MCRCYVVPMSTRMHITVEDELLARIDEVKHPDQSRAAFVRRCIVDRVAAPAASSSATPAPSKEQLAAQATIVPPTPSEGAMMERQRRLNERKG